MLLVLMLLLAALASPIATAGTVYRCIGSKGNAVFLDRPCDSMDLLERGAVATESNTSNERDTSNTGFCPAPDVASLQQAITDAFSRQDVNALAGLYHWPSVGRGGAGPVVNYLESLVKRPLLAINVRYRSRHRITVNGISRDVVQEDEDATGLHLELGGESYGATDSAELNLNRNAGCFWISEALR